MKADTRTFFVRLFAEISDTTVASDSGILFCSGFRFDLRREVATIAAMPEENDSDFGFILTQGVPLKLYGTGSSRHG